MKTVTLDKQFNGNFYLAIKYIVQNNLKIQKVNSLDNINDDYYWKDSTLRDLMEFAVCGKDDTGFYSYSMAFYRIKTKPTEQEVAQFLIAGNED